MKTLLLSSLLALAGTAACDSAKSNATSTSSTAAAVTTPTTLPAGLTRVEDPSQVCMVNDQFMGKPQIPIDVAGRTYYGCCPMCKERLANQPQSRTGTDPVTGRPVDKAVAIMLKDDVGKILYFENEDSLRKYRL